LFSVLQIVHDQRHTERFFREILARKYFIPFSSIHVVVGIIRGTDLPATLPLSLAFARQSPEFSVSALHRAMQHHIEAKKGFGICSLQKNNDLSNIIKRERRRRALHEAFALALADPNPVSTSCFHHYFQVGKLWTKLLVNEASHQLRIRFEGYTTDASSAAFPASSAVSGRAFTQFGCDLSRSYSNLDTIDSCIAGALTEEVTFWSELGAVLAELLGVDAKADLLGLLDGIDGAALQRSSDPIICNPLSISIGNVISSSSTTSTGLSQQSSTTWVSSSSLFSSLGSLLSWPPVEATPPLPLPRPFMSLVEGLDFSNSSIGCVSGYLSIGCVSGYSSIRWVSGKAKPTGFDGSPLLILLSWSQNHVSW
jgi:hypothetical protein